MRFIWVVGTTWLAAMGSSQSLTKVVRKLTRETGHEVALSDAFGDGDTGIPLQVEKVSEILKAKADNGGMVLIQQEIYTNALTDFADLVLPAAPWGEEDYTRMQGERRLRLYSQIMKPPGEAKPDWWIVAQVARRMGYDGFEW